MLCVLKVGVHTFSASTGEAEAGETLEFKASLVYKVSSRTTRATQKPRLKKTKSMFCVHMDP